LLLNLIQRRMKKVILVMGLILSGILIYAEEGENASEASKANVCLVKGQIMDKLNGESLTGVAVRIAGSDLVAYTDFDGVFTFKDLTPGSYTIETSMVSYQEEKITVEAKAMADNPVTIKLETISEN
jgi:hypothetical protein